MSEFFKSELKDRFLEYAADRDDYFEVQLLYDEFLRPHYSLAYAQKLIDEILEYDHRLLEVMSGNGAKVFMVASTPETVDFLEEGGFTDLYIREEEKWDTFFEHLSNNRKLTHEEIAILDNSKKATLKKEKRLLFLLIFAVAFSFLFALFSILKDSFSKEEYITRQELEERLQALESNDEKEILIEEVKAENGDDSISVDNMTVGNTE